MKIPSYDEAAYIFLLDLLIVSSVINVTYL